MGKFLVHVIVLLVNFWYVLNTFICRFSAADVPGECT